MRLAALAIAALIVGLPTVHGQGNGSESVLVFAAVSLKGALDDIAGLVRSRTGVTMQLSYAGTSVLAKQIEQGAPADLFVSADEQWMDYLAQRNLIARASRIDIVGNRLVLIAHKDSKVQLPIAPRFPLADVLGRGRLAIADPVNVPAGRYGKAALVHLGVWESVASRLAPADNVRAALAFVARREVPLGIVYQSDVVAEPNVRVVAIFPDDTHPRIVYPAALTAQAPREAERVLAVLVTPEATAIFKRHGFLPPPAR